MRKLALVCSALVAGALLTACGGDEEPTALAVAVTQARGDDALTLSAPDTIDSGAVEIRFDNQAEAPADVEMIGVEGTHTVAEVREVIDSEGGPIPTWLKPAGGLGTTPPGQTATATVELDEGTYYLISEVDSEDDPGPEPATKTLRVSGDGGGSLPSADTTITAKDYGFDVGDLKAGANEIRFENDGKQIHHVVAAPIAPGSTIDDVRSFFQTEGEPTGPPPVDFEAAANTAVVDSGKALVTTLNLKAGKYAFACFIQDREGGPPHFTKGMLQEATVSA